MLLSKHQQCDWAAFLKIFNGAIFVIFTNQPRTTYALIGTKFPNTHSKTKWGFEIQIQNLKVLNANIKREDSNLDSELGAKIIVN